MCHIKILEFIKRNIQKHLHWNVVGEWYSQLVWKHHEPLYLFHDQSPGDVTIDSVKHLKSTGMI